MGQVLAATLPDANGGLFQGFQRLLERPQHRKAPDGDVVVVAGPVPHHPHVEAFTEYAEVVVRRPDAPSFGVVGDGLAGLFVHQKEHQHVADAQTARAAAVVLLHLCRDGVVKADEGGFLRQKP